MFRWKTYQTILVLFSFFFCKVLPRVKNKCLSAIRSANAQVGKGNITYIKRPFWIRYEKRAGASRNKWMHMIERKMCDVKTKVRS